MDVLSGLKAGQVAPGGRRDSLGSSSSSSKSSFSASNKDKDFISALRDTSSEKSEPALAKNYEKPGQKTPRDLKDSTKDNVPPQVRAGVREEPVVKDVVAKEVQAKVEQPQTKEEMVDSIPRRIALQTFIRKMREDVGVDANQIMAAMAALSPEQLAAPPEQNMQAILSELNLQGDQKMKAEGLFEELLEQTATNSLADHLKTSGRELSMQVLSERELREKSMKEALARMNENFFVENKVATPVKEQNAEGSEQAPMSPNFWATGAAGGAAGAVAATSTSATAAAGTPATAAPGMFIPAGMQAVTPQSLNSEMGLKAQSLAESFGTEGSEALSQEFAAEQAGSEFAAEQVVNGESAQVAAEVTEGKKVENFKSLEEQLRGFKLENMQSRPAATKQAQAAYEMLSPKNSMLLPQAVDGAKASGLAPTNAEALTTGAVGMGAMVGGLSLMGAGDEQDSQAAEQEGFFNPQSLATDSQTKDMKQIDMSKFTVTMQPTAQEESANIKELINQAQFLSTKGGGEMKMALSPEGLGEVIMKVSVNGGQVNVEMMAESNEAKKLLEKGMGELKANLLSHKLNVENIKVDFQQSSDISKHMEDQRGQEQRQFAQDFLENFRQNNSGWRQGLTDMAGPTGRRGKSDGEEKDTQIRIEQMNAKNKRSDKRLDLVA